MKIDKEIFEEIINNAPNDKYENGGILGIGDKMLITKVAFDNGIDVESARIYSYYPDVHMLNQRIKEWADESIAFAGIFHTHFSKTA